MHSNARLGWWFGQLCWGREPLPAYLKVGRHFTLLQHLGAFHHRHSDGSGRYKDSLSYPLLPLEYADGFFSGPINPWVYFWSLGELHPQEHCNWSLKVQAESNNGFVQRTSNNGKKLAETERKPSSALRWNHNRRVDWRPPRFLAQLKLGTQRCATLYRFLSK